MKKNYLILLFFLTSIIMNYGQVAISYPIPAEVVTASYGNSFLYVRLDFDQVATAGADVTITLPTGFTYVLSSLVQTGTNSGLTIAENGGTANAPVFKIAPNTLNIGNWITFKIKRQANCGAISGTNFKDQISVTTSAGTVQDVDTSQNNYDLVYPALTFEQPISQNNANLNTNYTRTFSIINGGNGLANAIYFYINYPAGVSQVSLNLGATALVPTAIVGTTKYYTISSTMLPSGVLANGQELLFTEVFRLTKCDITTTYNVGWGDSSTTWCQTVSGIGTVTMAAGVPDYTVGTTTLLNYTDNACSPHDTKLTITNSGSGNTNAATMYNVVFTQIGNDMSATSRYTLSNFRIGTTVISPIFTGGLSSQTMTINLQNIALTSDPDGIGIGVEDVDGDGFYDDLPLGNTLSFFIQFQINDFRTAFCAPLNSTQGYWRWIYNVGYSTMCNSTVSYPKLGSYNSLIALSIDGTSFAMNNFTPSTIQGGIPFKVDSKITNVQPGLGDLFAYWPTSPTKRRWIHRFTMPAGVTLNGTGNPTINGVAATATTIGSVVSVNVDGQQQPGEITLDFIYACGTDGTITIPYTLEFIDDRITPCIIDNELFCYNFNMNVIGCSTCSVSGPSVSMPTVRRDDNSYGYTTGALTTRVAYTAIPVSERKQALYYDTIRIEGSMTQNGNASNLFHRFQLDKSSILHENKLLPLDATVTITRSGTLLTTTTLTISNISNADATATKSSFEWDLTSCLPTGGLINNDVVNIIARYKVSSRDLPTSSFIQAPNTAYTFYNKDISNIKLICSEFPIDLYLAVYSQSNNMEAQSNPLVGCGEVILGRYINYSTLGGVFPFGHEIRPISRFESIYITVSESITITRAVPQGSNVSGTASYIYYPTIVPNNSVSNGDGTKTVTFNNNGTFPINAGVGYTILDVYGIPGCDTPSGATYKFNQKLRRTYYGESVPYGTLDTNPSIDLWTVNTTSTKVFQNQPSITLNNQSGIIQATRPSENFTVRMSSTGTTTAPYTWLAIPTTPGINITSVVDVASSTTLSPTSYVGGVWYPISTIGLASGAIKDYTINFTYTNCGTVTFPVEAGWNCLSYPTDPSNYTCGKATANLTYTTSLSEIQVTEIPQAPTIALCASQNHLFEISNSQASNVKDSTFTLTMPVGYLPVGASFQVQYPRNSGTWQTVTPTIVGNVYTFNLVISGIYPAQGIPGTIYSTTDDDRFMMVRFQTNTDCNYVPGSKFQYSVEAKGPCGAIATGSNVNTYSN